MPQARRVTAVLAALSAACVLTLAAPASADTRSARQQADESADVYLRYSLGRLMELQGMLPDALVQYRRAYTMQPGECAIQTAIARVLFLLGRVEEARSPALASATNCPESVEATAVYAAVLLSLGEPALVESLLRERALDDGTPVELVVLFSQSLLAQDRAQDAEEVLRARAEKDTLSPRIAYMHAHVLVDIDRQDEAVGELLRAHRLDPSNPAVVELCTSVLSSLGRDEDVVRLLESFIETPSARARHAAALAMAHGRLGDDERALEVARAGLVRFGESADLLRVEGSVLFDTGDVDGALKAYERALELEPDSVRALNFLAYTLADLDIDAGRAVQLAERATELAPESGLIRDTLGWAYFRTARFEDAVRELSRAVALGEQDPVVLEHLGDALAASGQLDEAIMAWEKALAEDPDRGSSAAKIEDARARIESQGAAEGEGD